MLKIWIIMRTIVFPVSFLFKNGVYHLFQLSFPQLPSSISFDYKVNYLFRGMSCLKLFSNLLPANCDKLSSQRRKRGFRSNQVGEKSSDRACTLPGVCLRTFFKLVTPSHLQLGLVFCWSAQLRLTSRHAKQFPILAVV